MEDLKYCRACLVTDVKMYSLDITSNDCIGLVYSYLTQIRICGRNQYVCFECECLLKKYELFKSKCIRAHNILANIAVNSIEITKQMLQDIDRKENKLESSLVLFSPKTSCCGTKNDSYNNIQLNEVGETKKMEIKIEIQNVETDKHCPTNSEISNMFNKKYIIDEVNERVSDEIKNKPKELKPKRRKIKNEVNVTETDDFGESFSDFNDYEFIDSPEENKKEISPPKRKTKVKDSKTKKKKSKTVINSDDNLSDNEPLSKCATRIADIIKEPLGKKSSLNIEFFDDYATVKFLTPDDARKELLSRKESSNYKRSPFKCEFCYKGYLAKAAFENHMKKHSAEYGNYECDLCHLRFPKHIYLCKHRLSCHKRKFSCKLCPYVCYCMYQARTHVSLHKGKKYPCKDCGEIFSMPNSLLMHKRVKHLDESDPENVCEICGNTFGSPRGLFLHNMKIHRMEKNSKQGPKCEECNVHFSSEVAWKRHLVLSVKHTVSNGCKYCGERFTSGEELKSHKQTHHPRDRPKFSKKLPAACTVCNKWLSNEAEYEHHVSTEHPHLMEIKKQDSDVLSPFVCEICGQTFKQQCFLTYHQRRHTGERPYACGACGKTFPLAGALATHRAVHARRRTIECHLCARLFSFKSALNKHMKIHLGIRPHKCAICDKGFLHMCDLKLHIKYVHDKVPWPKKKSKRNVADDNATFLEYN